MSPVFILAKKNNKHDRKRLHNSHNLTLFEVLNHKPPHWFCRMGFLTCEHEQVKSYYREQGKTASSKNKQCLPLNPLGFVDTCVTKMSAFSLDSTATA